MAPSRSAVCSRALAVKSGKQSRLARDSGYDQALPKRGTQEGRDDLGRNVTLSHSKPHPAKPLIKRITKISTIFWKDYLDGHKRICRKGKARVVETLA